MEESQKHLRAKERIRDLARARGRIAENEVPFISYSGYRDKVIWYSADIFICSYGQRAPQIIEIDGYKGHRSRFATGRDTRRTEDIKNLWGDNIVVRRYTLEELEIATDEEIQTDLDI